MTTRDSVRFGDTTIEYEVRRSRRRRKTIQITVDRDGVHVAAPARTPYRELRAIVHKRARWILRHAAEAMLEPAPMQFVSGETLPYLGRTIRLTVAAADVPCPEVRFDRSRFRVTVPRAWTTARVASRSAAPSSGGTGPSRRAAGGRRRALVAQARPGSEVAGARPRSAAALG